MRPIVTEARYSTIIEAIFSSRNPQEIILTHHYFSLLFRLLALGLIWIPQVAAGDSTGADKPTVPWPDIDLFAVDSTTLLAAAAEAAPDVEDADAVYLWREYIQTFHEPGRKTSLFRAVIYLHTAQGVEDWSVANRIYRPWMQSRPELRYRIVTPAGKEYRLDPKTLSERPNGDQGDAIFEDELVLEGPLPGVVKGAVVVAEEIVHDEKPYFNAGLSSRINIESTSPVLRQRLTIDVPQSVPFRFEVRGTEDLAPTKEEHDDRVVWVFDVDHPSMTDEIPWEEGRPSDEPRWVHVGFATGESWGSVARAYHEVVEQLLADAESAQLLEGFERRDESTADTIARVLAYLHDQVRYTGLELGAFGLIPAAPSTTLERSYGDCKDKATLLVAMLRALGIEANVALLLTGPGVDVDPTLPGLGRFDHAIVKIMGSSPVWVDPTHPGARAGELPLPDQDRYALVVHTNATELERTPVAPSSANGTIEHREIQLTSYGDGSVIETTVYRGSSEQSMRTVTSDWTPESTREGLASYIATTYSDAELTDVEWSPPDDLDQPFTLRMAGEGVGSVVSDLREAIVVLGFGTLFEDLPSALIDDLGEEIDPRESDLVLYDPYRSVLRYTIRPASGMTPRDLPADRAWELGTGSFTMAYFADDDGVVHVEMVFDTGPRRLNAAAITAFRSGLHEIGQAELPSIWFDHTIMADLAAGRIENAISGARKLIDAEPEQPDHRVRYAQVLLAAGFGELAQSETARAVELAPESMFAHMLHGYTLEHDDIGRRFGPGYQREAAIASLTKATEFAPDDEEAATELAVAFEHDSTGTRYGADADLSDAIEIYRRLRKESEDTSYDTQLLAALFYDHHWAELADAHQTFPSSDTRNIVRATAIAVQDGVPAALRAVEQMSANQAAQPALLQQVAQHLLITRHYPQSGEVLRRAASRTENPAATFAQADVIGNVKRSEELEVDLTDPKSTARSLLGSLMGHPIDLERSRPLVAESLATAWDATEVGLQIALETLRGDPAINPGALPDPVFFDIGVQSFTTDEIDGDDETGYRIQMTPALDPSAEPWTTFFGMRNGEPKMVAGDRLLAGLGTEAIRLIDTGEFAAAATWLDWAEQAITRIQTEDPFGFHPFARLWPTTDEASADDMRVAAATLMTDAAHAEAALAILKPALTKITDDTNRQEALQLAILQATLISDDSKALEAVASTMLKAHPTSETVFQGQLLSLLQAERWSAAETLIEQRKKRLPNDPATARSEALLAQSRGAFADAIAAFKAIPTGDREAVDYNQWAWFLLFEDTDPEQALTLAQKGAGLEGYQSDATLHTLATAYAQMDRPVEANRIVQQAISLRPDKQVTSDDWFVFGRTAETYGLLETARAYYRRIDEPDDDPYAAVSTFELARKRLAILDETGDVGTSR